MRADKIWAVDNDPRAIRNAEENMIENKAGPINFVCADKPNKNWGIFDYILVNIQLQVILSALTALVQMLYPNGKILISGVLEKNYPILSEALLQKLLTSDRLIVENAWIAGVWSRE